MIRSNNHTATDNNLEPGHPLFRFSKFRYLPLIIILLLVMNLVATCGNTSAVQRAALHQPRIFLQTPDGITVSATPVDPMSRTDKVVGQFAEDFLKIAYSWKLPSPQSGMESKDKLERADAATANPKNSVTERGKAFPYPFYFASLAIEPQYRASFMDAEAKKYDRQFSFQTYISGIAQCYVRVYTTKVMAVDKGLWDVAIVATRLHASGDTILASEVFNRVIREKAVDPPNDERRLWGDRDTHLGQLLNLMQQQGLQIIQISEF